MKLKDFLGTMKTDGAGSKLIISTRSRYNAQHILEIDGWEDDETGKKYFDAEHYRHDVGNRIGVDRDDNEPLYGSNTAEEFLATCTTLDLDEDITELDWEPYQTREELLGEIEHLHERIKGLEEKLERRGDADCDA